MYTTNGVNHTGIFQCVCNYNVPYLFCMEIFLIRNLFIVMLHFKKNGSIQRRKISLLPNHKKIWHFAVPQLSFLLAIILFIAITERHVRITSEISFSVFVYVDNDMHTDSLSKIKSIALSNFYMLLNKLNIFHFILNETRVVERFTVNCLIRFSFSFPIIAFVSASDFRKVSAFNKTFYINHHVKLYIIFISLL